MELSDKAVREFKETWKKEYGRELTDSEAREQSTRLIKFFELLIDVDRRITPQKKKL